jgi:hypothetical protein
VGTYYNRFQELLNELQDAETNIMTKSAIRHFIFTLGPEFETIQNNYRIGNLPAQWNREDWPTILVLCRDYFNSVKPQGFLCRDSSHVPDSNFDHIAHQKKVKEWFLSPMKFCKEIESEQAKYIGKCLYHLTKSHQTCDCFVKKECDRILATKKASTPSNSMTSLTGQLRHIMEETFEDAVDDSLENCTDELGKDTNYESLHYFARVSYHYLRLVKSLHTLDA